MKLPNAQVEPLKFAALDGWKDDDHAAGLRGLPEELQRHPARRQGDAGGAAGSIGGLFNACKRASAVALGREQARKFFEDNFKPVRVAPHGKPDGFFTGYYETEVEGSRAPTDEFKVPLYSAPRGRRSRRKLKAPCSAISTAAEIEDGALKGKNLEICYVKNPVDAFFAQIQGSTRVKLDGGKSAAPQLHRQQRPALLPGRHDG